MIEIFPAITDCFSSILSQAHLNSVWGVAEEVAFPPPPAVVNVLRLFKRVCKRMELKQPIIMAEKNSRILPPLFQIDFYTLVN